MLVGGQAVNFWASFYESRVPELAHEAPFTSEDIDVCLTVGSAGTPVGSFAESRAIQRS